MNRQFSSLLNYLIFTSIGFCLLLVSACQNSLSRVGTPTPVTIITLDQPTSTLTPTFTKVPTIFPTITNTDTPTPTVTPTTTATNTPTLTPAVVTTLSPVAALAVVEDLLTHNANCSLPCWWGATPGQTAWQEIEGLLMSLSAQVVDWDKDVQIVYIAHVPEGLTGNSRGMQIYYKLEQSIIQNITITGGNIPTYYLQPILTNHGPPDEVWLQAMPYTPGGEVIFRIALLYLEKGFSVHILTRERYLEDEYVVGCFAPESEQGTFLFLWEPGRYNSFPAIVEAGRFGQEASSYIPLEEATGMSIASFYDMYLDDRNEYCISTPIDTWEN